VFKMRYNNKKVVKIIVKIVPRR
jgi:hypothetical protein